MKYNGVVGYTLVTHMRNYLKPKHKPDQKVHFNAMFGLTVHFLLAGIKAFTRNIL